MSTCFQSYEDPPGADLTAPRIEALRAELLTQGLDGFIVPRSDEHQGEYVPECAERLAWITGFTGSAGLAIILRQEAAIFVDGRYTLQVQDQVDLSVLTPQPIHEIKPTDWLKERLSTGQRIGFDPWLLTIAEAERFRTVIEKAGGRLIATDGNPIDAIWSDRPAPPLGSVRLHPDHLAGQSMEEKLKAVKEKLAEKSADELVLTDPASIAWLFNIRGSDVAHNPVPLSFAIVAREGAPSLYIDGRKLSNGASATLEGNVDLHEPFGFQPTLKSVSATTPVLVDPSGAADAVRLALEEAGAEIVEGSDPIQMLKAVKNDAERAGARTAHSRDGAAVVRFLAWLDRSAAEGALDEITAAKRLEAFRRETGELKEISFDTISGAADHGAIVHYRVTEGTNQRLEPGTLYLIDSGGQYEDGTTDITRTVAIGEPTDKMRRAFTLVLKGHIALALARFPNGTTGAQLDTLARLHLWRAGLDYDHGTGHGVGSYLSVHEGPARIAKTGSVALEPGMILSNEPGYYLAGQFGIRIENLVMVTEAEEIDGGERPMMGFETLTLAPIDRRLIDAALLTDDERDWLNAYHRRVLAQIGPLIDAGTQDWLAAATAPIG